MAKTVEIKDVVEGLKKAHSFDSQFASDLLDYAQDAKTELEIQSVINIIKNERDKTAKIVAFDTLRYILKRL